MPVKPSGKVIRLVRQRAHVAGAYIQQVIAVVCSISEATSRLAATLDQDRFRPVMARKIHRQQRSAETAADDRNTFRYDARAP